MITKEELRRIPMLHKQIQRDKEQLIYLRAKATAIPSALGKEEEKVQQPKRINANLYIEAAVDLDKEVKGKEAELEELQRRAKKYIKTIDDNLTRRIMKLRYLKCQRWDEIAELCGYAIRYIQDKEHEAIEKI